MSVHIHQSCASAGLGTCHPRFSQNPDRHCYLLNQIGRLCSHFRMRCISLLTDLKHERTFFDCKIWHPLVFTLCGTGDDQWNAQHIFLNITVTCSGRLNVAVIRLYSHLQFHLIQAYYLSQKELTLRLLMSYIYIWSTYS